MIYFYSSKIFDRQVLDFLFCFESIIKNNPNIIYVYLDLDDVSEANRNVIEKRLNLHNTIVVRPGRPIDKKGWISELEFLKDNHGDTHCCFMLNHDHAFVDQEARERFEQVSDEFISVNDECFFYYGHTAELACYLIFPPIGLQFKKFGQYYLYDGKVKWVDGYFSAKLSTIHNFMTLLKLSPDYLPRPDWPGAEYHSSRKKIAFCLEELCYHLDGYDHFVTPAPIDYRENVELDLSMLKMQLLHLDFALRKCCLFSAKIRSLLLIFLGRLFIQRYEYKCNNQKLNNLVNDVIRRKYIVKSLSYKRILYSFAPALFKKLFQRRVSL